ncbi:uncharacterized protein LOC143301765, partial [Babylonia areolata]|uniref:uncharacterized protein LOC143301765 n=1 Tax=Babylonia areolata TaxID=304850 RepID=UPI003FD3559D
MQGTRGPMGGGWLVVVAVVATVCSLPPVAMATYLRFEPGFEYQYKYQSKAQVHRVDTFTMEARVGYTCIREVSDGQEIKLNVIALSLRSGKGQGVTNHMWDFSKWFSFVLTPRGEVLHVTHEAKGGGAWQEEEEGEEEPGEEETVVIKKGLAALLAARLHHHTDQVGVKIVKTGEGWKYDVKELGHEGPHNATYHAQPTARGVTFTKVRHDHPVAHAKASYAKTMHYHNDLGMFHTVEIKEHFDVMSDPPEGYDPYFKGQQRPEEEYESPVLPSMTGEGQGQLQFLTKIKVKNVQSLVPPDVAMVNTSIHVDKVQKKSRRKTAPEKTLQKMTDQITGNLTCMRTPGAEGRVIHDCFKLLLAVLKSLPNRDVTTLAHDYLGPKTRLTQYQRDQEHMLDALWSVGTAHAQNAVTGTVLLSDSPDPPYVERLLYLIGGNDHLPSEFILQTIVTLTLKPEEQAKVYRSGVLRHRLVLILGALIGRLREAGQTERASSLGSQVQDMLGLHDPYEFRRKRSTMTEEETIAEDQWKVVLLESLGNARLDQSYEHIVSHVNNTNSQWVKRAGVHALRHYHHEHAANVILMAAMYDEHDTVRFESAREYVRHPAASVSVPSNSSFIGPRNAGPTAVGPYQPLHHRGRRALFDPIGFVIESPTVDWQKIIGSTKIGASFGLTIRNRLDILIGLLNGHGKVDIFDEAYGQVNLGFMGFHIDILRLRLCFKGHAEYNLNLLQEFDIKDIPRMVEMFDKLKKQTVGAVLDGIKLFRNILEGNPPVADIIKGFGDAIKNLPNKMLEVGQNIQKALEKISQYDDKQLPPFAVKLKNLVLRVSNLINDVRSDVTGFYNKLMTATVVIPYGAKQIFLSVENIIDSFKILHRDPKSAISTVTGSALTIGLQVKSIVEAVKEAKEAAFFLKKEKPYWWDLRANARDFATAAKEVINDMKTEGRAWVNAGLEEVKDKINEFSSGSIDKKALKQSILDDLGAIPNIVKSLLPLENLGDNIQGAFTTLFELITTVKKAYEQLRDGARRAKEFIERVFGPKAHKRFPRVTRTPGNDCEGTGFYPSTLEAEGTEEYTYEGVDLLLSPGSKVVAPFPGILYRSSERDNEVMIEARGGSPRGVLYVITNVKANRTVKRKTDSMYTNVRVVAGQMIGWATASPCGGDKNHIHLAMRKGDDTVDPTRYLESRLAALPQWVQECDDYKFVYKGQTMAAGSIAGLVGRKKNDTSPERTPEPEAPRKLPANRNPSSTLDKDFGQEEDSVSAMVKENEDEAVETAEDSKDSVLKTLLQNAMAFLQKFNVKDLKMGSMVKFLHSLKFDNSLDKLTKVFRTIQAMLDNKPCLNPNAMTEEELRTLLRQQGKDSTGSRDTMLATLRQRSNSQ